MANLYFELYLDPGSCGGNASSTGPKSLVPGKSFSGGNWALVLFQRSRTVGGGTWLLSMLIG